MTYSLMYSPGTPLGTKFPTWVLATFRAREAAEAVRSQCASASQIAVVEAGESPSLQGETGKIGAQVKTAPTQSLHLRTGPRSAPILKGSANRG